MKFTAALFILIAASVSHADPACVDISGDYTSPYDSGDRTTTFSITQDQCKDVSVLSIIIVSGSPSVSRGYYKLDGTSLAGCSKDYFNDCGSMKITVDGIEKTSPKNTLAGDDVHGLCQFVSTVLTKDAQGNLVESVKSAKCEDGYVGSLSRPVVYPKK